MSLEMENDMTYTSSDAFALRGTRLFVDGVEISEVRRIDFSRPENSHRKTMSFRTNYIPSCQGQLHVMNLHPIGHAPWPTADIEIEYPHRLGKISLFNAMLEGYETSIPANDAAQLLAIFSYGSLHHTPAPVHNVEDGPEVDVIEREQEIEFEPIANMLRRYFAEERVKEHSGFGRTRPAGGGFREVMVSDGHSYHYSRD